MLRNNTFFAFCKSPCSIQLLYSEKHSVGYNYLLNAIVDWVRELPKYSKELKSNTPKEYIDLLNVLKTPGIGAQEILFNRTKKIFNSDDYANEIFHKIDEFKFYYDNATKGHEEPFVDLGLAYIKFASEEPHLFSMLFLSDKRYDKTMYEILNGSKGIVGEQMSKAKAAGCANSGDLFTKMWIFIHGAACMSITGDYDLPEAETVKLLIETYKAYR